MYTFYTRLRRKKAPRAIEGLTTHKAAGYEAAAYDTILINCYLWRGGYFSI